jgi:hypothetical protein
LALLLASHACWLPLLFLAGAVPGRALSLRAHLLFQEQRRRSWYPAGLITSAAARRAGLIRHNGPDAQPRNAQANSPRTQ